MVCDSYIEGCEELRFKTSSECKEHAQIYCSWFGCTNLAQDHVKTCLYHDELDREKNRKSLEKRKIAKREEPIDDKMPICSYVGCERPAVENKKSCQFHLVQSSKNYYSRKETNRCPRCPKPLVPGKSDCGNHLKSRQAPKAARKGRVLCQYGNCNEVVSKGTCRCEFHRKYHNAAARLRNTARRHVGLCISCGEPAAKGYISCLKHREARNKYQARYRAAKKALASNQNPREAEDEEETTAATPQESNDPPLEDAEAAQSLIDMATGNENDVDMAVDIDDDADVEMRSDVDNDNNDDVDLDTKMGECSDVDDGEGCESDNDVAIISERPVTRASSSSPYPFPSPISSPPPSTCPAPAPTTAKSANRPVQMGIAFLCN